MEEFLIFEKNIEDTIVEPTAEKLLAEWGFPDLIEEFLRKGIDIEVFKELNNDDLKTLIPDESFGVRIKFRKKLYQWQLEQGCRSTAATTTVVDSWLSSLPVSIVTEQSELATSSPINSERSSHFPSTSSVFTDEIENNSSMFNLEKELVATNKTQGTFILSQYKKGNPLTNTDRQYIVQVVADHLISKNTRITNSEYKRLSQQIVQLFPTEDEATYFGTDKQRGKIAEKYYTLSKKFVKSGVIEKPIKRKLSEVINIPHKQLITDIENIEDQENNFLWLQKNFSPETLVVDKWKKSFQLRRNHINDLTTDILKQWPILKQKIGVSLVEIDYERLYPEKSTYLFSKWDCFYLKIVKIFHRDIKDSYCRKLLISLGSITNEDSKNFITTILLNAVLIPQIIKTKGLQKAWKPSILDAQKSFTTYLVDKSYIQSTIELKKKQSKEKNARLQPSIIVIGDNPENITQFFIYFDDILYEIENYLKAVSITYQLHFVLGLEYSVECAQVWQFIEEYFYEMKTNKRRNSTLNALLNELKYPINE